MISKIIEHLLHYISLSSDEITAISESIPIQSFSKGSILLKEGEVSKHAYFNIKGCVRLYYLIDGEEKTTFFYTENQFITSIKSFTNRVPAHHFLECVEDCTLGVLSYEAEIYLLKKFPKFEYLSRILLEEELGHYQDMLSTYITTKPEDRYKKLLKLNPQLLQRIPQYQLATFLGVTPESLSRIRKRIIQ